MATASVSTIEAATSRTEGVETGVVRETKVDIKQTGKIVYNVDQYLFARANFYIEASRQYFKGRKFTRYVYYTEVFHYIYFTMLVGLFVAPFNYIGAFLLLLLNIPHLIMFTQHLYVNIQTMRYVLKQPEVPDGTLPTTNNAHLEITLEEFTASYAASQQAGLGLIVHGKGTVKIQVFEHSTKNKMKICVCLSTFYFLCAVFLTLYFLIFGIIGGVYGGGVALCYISSNCK